MLVDSHCHLDRLNLEHFGSDLAAAVKAATELGVSHMLCVGIDLKTFPGMMEIVKRFSNVYASVGVHPNEREGEEPTITRLVEASRDRDVVAIGETGLDYFRSTGDLEWHRQRFRTHIAAARQTELPLIIHTRDSMDDALCILEQEEAQDVGGVMHCFTGDWEDAKRALSLGFYISFSGIVTFSNARDIQEAAKYVPDDRLLVETDSPYLAPHPYRGKPNQPAWTRFVAEKLAELRQTNLESIAEITTGNFARPFKLSLAENPA